MVEPEVALAYARVALVTTLALWIGWAVLVAGGVMLAASLVTWIPYMVLNACWHRLKVQDDFIRLAVLYFKDRRRAEDRRIMGDPE